MSAAKERERQGKRKVEEEERTEKEERREKVKRRRKRAATTSGRVYLRHMTRVCQHCQALIFPSEPLNCCCNGKISLPLLGYYPSPLKDLFTLQSLATSRTSGSTTVPSPLLHLN